MIYANDMSVFMRAAGEEPIVVPEELEISNEIKREVAL